jgi:hypothetical protein
VEKRLLAEWNGWPTTIWLRHRDDNLPQLVRARYHAFFARNVPLYVTPTKQQEAADPKAADAIYASAVKWLQERCRGKAFPLVEKENAEYGFRRNLRGLKPIGLTACCAALLISALAILWQYEPLLPAFASLSAKTDPCGAVGGQTCGARSDLRRYRRDRGMACHCPGRLG